MSSFLNTYFVPRGLIVAMVGLFPVGTTMHSSHALLGKAADVVQLPKPQTNGGKPLMRVLNKRKSIREYSEKELSKQVLSNLLWAASGINRTDTGKRTAPSAMNWQEIDIYVATSNGFFLYDAQKHQLQTILKKDIRALTGTQNYVKTAPLNLVFVADFSKMGSILKEHKIFLSAANTGFISQNVYLFCASENLATVVRASVDKEKLAKLIGLNANQMITLAQSVGYPKG